MGQELTAYWKKDMTRESVMERIAEAVIFGNLGLFIGAGLPMAIFNRRSAVAFSWAQIIHRCFRDFHVPFKKDARVGSSYPQIATHLCKAISKKKRVSFKEAESILKAKIADLTCLYPSRTEREKYLHFFEELDPSWIITTNYDTVIESILTGRCVPLSSNDQLVVPKNLIPVYHLHGSRLAPESIVITQDDYVSLFRPNQYRLQKLPLLLKESFTVLIGYSLGDFNVLTALDWSKNVFAEGNSYPAGLVQLIYNPQNSRKEPYYDENGVIILEFAKLPSILDIPTKGRHDSAQKVSVYSGAKVASWTG